MEKPKIQMSQSHVLKSLQIMQRSGVLCDLELTPGDGKCVLVHSLIWVAAFEFANDFQDTTLHWQFEVNMKRLDLPGISGKLLNTVVDFIYGEDIEIEEDSGIFDVLEKLGMKSNAPVVENHSDNKCEEMLEKCVKNNIIAFPNKAIKSTRSNKKSGIDESNISISQDQGWINCPNKTSERFNSSTSDISDSVKIHTEYNASSPNDTVTVKVEFDFPTEEIGYTQQSSSVSETLQSSIGNTTHGSDPRDEQDSYAELEDKAENHDLNISLKSEPLSPCDVGLMHNLYDNNNTASSPQSIEIRQGNYESMTMSEIGENETNRTTDNYDHSDSILSPTSNRKGLKRGPKPNSKRRKSKKPKVSKVEVVTVAALVPYPNENGGRFRKIIPKPMPHIPTALFQNVPSGQGLGTSVQHNTEQRDITPSRSEGMSPPLTINRNLSVGANKVMKASNKSGQGQGQLINSKIEKLFQTVSKEIKQKIDRRKRKYRKRINCNPSKNKKAKLWADGGDESISESSVLEASGNPGNEDSCVSEFRNSDDSLSSSKRGKSITNVSQSPVQQMGKTSDGSCSSSKRGKSVTDVSQSPVQQMDKTSDGSCFSSKHGKSVSLTKVSQSPVQQLGKGSDASCSSSKSVAKVPQSPVQQMGGLVTGSLDCGKVSNINTSGAMCGTMQMVSGNSKTKSMPYVTGDATAVSSSCMLSSKDSCTSNLTASFGQPLNVSNSNFIPIISGTLTQNNNTTGQNICSMMASSVPGNPMLMSGQLNGIPVGTTPFNLNSMVSSISGRNMLNETTNSFQPVMVKKVNTNTSSNSFLHGIPVNFSMQTAGDSNSVVFSGASNSNMPNVIGSGLTREIQMGVQANGLVLGTPNTNMQVNQFLSPVAQFVPTPNILSQSAGYNTNIPKIPGGELAISPMNIVPGSNNLVFISNPDNTTTANSYAPVNIAPQGGNPVVSSITASTYPPGQKLILPKPNNLTNEQAERQITQKVQLMVKKQVRGVRAPLLVSSPLPKVSEFFEGHIQKEKETDRLLENKDRAETAPSTEDLTVAENRDKLKEEKLMSDASMKIQSYASLAADKISRYGKKGEKKSSNKEEIGSIGATTSENSAAIQSDMSSKSVGQRSVVKNNSKSEDPKMKTLQTEKEQTKTSENINKVTSLDATDSVFKVPVEFRPVEAPFVFHRNKPMTSVSPVLSTPRISPSVIRNTVENTGSNYTSSTLFSVARIIDNISSGTDNVSNAIAEIKKVNNSSVASSLPSATASTFSSPQANARTRKNKVTDSISDKASAIMCNNAQKPSKVKMITIPQLNVVNNRKKGKILLPRTPSKTHITEKKSETKSNRKIYCGTVSGLVAKERPLFDDQTDSIKK